MSVVRRHLGEVLEQSLTERDWSQADLAEQLGVSHVTVYRWIDKGVVPRSGLLFRIAEVLDLEPAHVLEAARETAEGRRDDPQAARTTVEAQNAELREQVAALQAQVNALQPRRRSKR